MVDRQINPSEFKFPRKRFLAAVAVSSCLKSFPRLALRHIRQPHLLLIIEVRGQPRVLLYSYQQHLPIKTCCARRTNQRLENGILKAV